MSETPKSQVHTAEAGFQWARAFKNTKWKKGLQVVKRSLIQKVAIDFCTLLHCHFLTQGRPACITVLTTCAISAFLHILNPLIMFSIFLFWSEVYLQVHHNQIIKHILKSINRKTIWKCHVTHIMKHIDPWKNHSSTPMILNFEGLVGGHRQMVK